MSTQSLRLVLVLSVMAGPTGFALPATAANGAATDGATLYKEHCSASHDHAAAHIPPLSAIKAMTEPAVRSALQTDCSPAQSAAVTVAPGVVSSGSVDGHMRAFASRDGRLLWDYDTVRTYHPVNGGSAQGGAIDGGGPAVYRNMVFFNSGYSLWGGKPGNVLLAFSLDGR